MKKYAQRIKELRLDNKMTQGALAVKTGVSQSIVARWESGECEPTVTNIVALANCFNVSTDYLTGKTDD